MTLHSVDLRSTGQFPALLLDYLEQKPGLEAFYSIFPTLENAAEAIAQRRSFDPEKRKTLAAALKKQYANLPHQPDFSILEDPNTFTVTTGHQLNIFSGPLYIIYKIVTIIRLAEALKETYPEYNFVPVYWMATEDHDFAEIASFHLFDQTHIWTGEHKGAVGRLNPHELESIIRQLPIKPLLFTKAYLENDTLADAVRCYMHELFGQKGLVCLDADDASLKRHFLPVIQDELLQNSSGKIVSEITSRLNTLGYHTPLNAREINLFYLKDNLRERIIKEEDTFKVVNSDLTFSEKEILSLTAAHPEYFSPNVVLRPLYEEIILPNLAYIGGPSEVPYWMQLKGVFDHFGVPFPMLIPRNFALYLNNKQHQKARKLGIKTEELFLDEVALRKLYIERHSEHQLDLEDQKDAFERVFEEILAKAVAVEPTMHGAVKAEQTRLMHSLRHLEKRISKAEEHHHESAITQLLALKNKLFPNGTAQERYDNLLNFYIDDPRFIDKLFNAFDPLDFRYNVLLEE
ncbi:bacillithiol biosynthesis cysteine-adding enzyme BshC [Dyadobacter sandarakinus]|uniref:Putative cysteine ligase BshC n=1 Tax=Dyadobacter sandarakinus TaxID=2747268 RepID=A0ABX7IBZ7_9BACT|nr:bacillithiol biosynthesis cysteine-adding enzyme BshC [Dyadobacter sandarakinus]QRR02982.1 bacillithiol biosynthesis cysteine-adding enzyme BshC [Dyadobacter sandarakinus]